MKTRVSAIIYFALLMVACMVELPDPVRELNIQVNSLSNTYNSISVSASAGGSSYNGKSISEFGVELNGEKIKSPNLTSFDSTLRVSVQNYQQRYEVRAYAILSGKTFYSAKQEVTVDVSDYIPVISSVVNKSKTHISLVMSAAVSDDKGLPVTERGFCWKEGNGSPTVLDNKIVIGAGTGSFSDTIKGLTPNSTYCVSAYAINEAGTSYSSYKSYTTDNANDHLPVMSNVSKISETHNSIVIMARVLEDNDSPIVERGFCWSIIANPDTSSNKVIVGNGIGEFSTTITDITPNTKYYIKAYAINTSGIKYSSEVSYSIDNATSYYPVIASIFNEVKTSFSLTMSATITEDKGSAVIERGFCWNKTGSPTMLENKISTGSGTGAFTSTIVGLEANTTYYVRAYATNAAGTSYYGNDGYTTHNANDYLPIIGTVSKTEETYGKLTVSSIISDDKGSHVTERGFCYSSPNSTPSITNGDKVVAGSGTGTFSSTLRNLSNTTYYIRAYAINAAGVSYSNSQTYSMREKDYYLPLVSSVNSNAPNSTTLTLTSSTSLVAYNSASVTERGFCWSATDSTPNINDNKVVASGSGVGSFSSTISNLSPTTTYCYRAYASNEWGIRYSNVVCGNYTNISSAFSYTCPYGFCVINSFVVVIDGYQGSPGKCWSTTNTLPTTNDNYETKSVVLDHGDRREYPFEINRIYDDTTYVRSCVRLEDGNMVYGKVISYTCGIYYHNTGGVFNNTVRIDGCRQVY